MLQNEVFIFWGVRVTTNQRSTFGILHFSLLVKHQHASGNPVYHQHFYLVVHSFVFSKEGILLRTAWVCLASYLKPPLLDGLYHILITRFYTNSSIWIQLEKGQDDIKLRRSLKSSKNGWLTNNGWGGGELLIIGGFWPLCKLCCCLVISLFGSSDIYIWIEVT